MEVLTSRAVAEMTAGICGGVLQAIVGHPLDTLKVRLQAQGGSDGIPSRFRGSVGCLVDTVRCEGTMGLYKGVSAPIVCAGFQNAALFALSGFSKRTVAYLRDVPVDRLSTIDVALSALLAAPGYCAVVTPVDLIKSRLQVQSGGDVAQLYRGPLHCALVTARECGVSGMFSGYAATVGTRVLGLPAMFATYDLAQTALRNEDGSSMIGPASAGALAGWSFWLFALPADVVKTRMQTRRSGMGGPGRAGVLATAVEIYAQSGWRGFYSGAGPCLLRAGPANAVAFWSVEMCLSAMGHSRF